MIHGTITNDRPHIPLTIGWGSVVENIVAIVDTSFTGGIKIPPESVGNLGLAVSHTELVVLGDGQVVNMAASIVYVDMEGRVEVANAIVAPGDIVIGVGLMKKFSCLFNADFHNSKIRMRPRKFR